jgi:hypothetical protein
MPVGFLVGKGTKDTLLYAYFMPQVTAMIEIMTELHSYQQVQADSTAILQACCPPQKHRSHPEV